MKRAKSKLVDDAAKQLLAGIAAKDQRGIELIEAEIGRRGARWAAQELFRLRRLRADRVVHSRRAARPAS